MILFQFYEVLILLHFSLYYRIYPNPIIRTDYTLLNHSELNDDIDRVHLVLLFQPHRITYGKEQICLISQANDISRMWAISSDT
ncbi:hypothetical protein Xekk_00971 [Xenorhabdus sp. KK7.4]|nr:hypothetical protein Xekk_00971 [Xenorhabdus sp. KK7.4]